MLNSFPSQGQAFSQRRFSSPNSQCNDLVTIERIRRQEEAEKLANIGLFEIAISLDGESENQQWSAGIYAILRRDRQAPPLPRDAYILQYVHPEDQQRVSALSLDAIEHGRPVDIAYRIVRDDCGVSDVTERLAVVTTTASERLLFADLKELPRRGPAVVASGEAQKSSPDDLLPSHAELAGTQGLLATFELFREREHQRLARELHDDFGQLLAAMKLDLCMLSEKTAQGDSTGLSQIDSLQELVDTMIASTRRIIAELPPKAVDELGLFPALEQLVAGFRKRHPIQLTFRMASPSTRLDAKVELAVYRILQETLTNVVRHANATTVYIDVECSTTYLRLKIRDDGKGITAAEMAKSGSFGLLWMRERVLGLAGTVDIDSVSGQGTAIAISLPLQQATPACDT